MHRSSPLIGLIHCLLLLSLTPTTGCNGEINPPSDNPTDGSIVEDGNDADPDAGDDDASGGGDAGDDTGNADPGDNGSAGGDGDVSDDGTDGDDAGDDGNAGDDSNGSATVGRYFPDDAVWYQDISAAPLDAESDAVINWLDDNGGFGLGRMQIDFSIEVLEADADTPVLAFDPTDDWYDPDCDLDPVPVPLVGALEGEDGYACDNDGDCHLIVVDRLNDRLYEMWRANIVGDEFFGGCLAVWDMSRVYDGVGRGRDCTSADAAGFPIAPLLFSADEVVAGSVDHAIRFILPNARIRHRVYVEPATHSTGATGGSDDAPPYGARFRLRSDFPLADLPNDAARAVARGLQRYGMFLADGGNVALTAQSDRFTTAKWDGLLGPHDLTAVQITDFEMIEAGERYSWIGDCVREP